MSGPPGPWAVRVNVCVPAANPVTVCVPAVAVLLRPGPVTVTEEALLVLHVRVVEPGARPVVGLAEIAPATAAASVTVTVAVCVAGPFGPCAVIV